MKAVIDIGSNSVLLLVGERRPDRSVVVEMDRATITRLSKGVGQSGRLSDGAIERTLACLRGYRAIIDERGLSFEAVATEGVRMAQNGAAFLEPAGEVLGRAVRLISGKEEARLSYLSVAYETPNAGPLRVLDIGGASTELVVGRGDTVLAYCSHRIGSVRLTEAHVHSDPPRSGELEAIESTVREALATQPVDPYPTLHGLAGTVTTAAAVMLDITQYDREAVDGQQFDIEQIRSLRNTLASETIAQRAQRPCIGAGRADVIVTGVTILLGVMEHCGAHTLNVRDRGLRYALL